jgi:hypothetical protein
VAPSGLHSYNAQVRSAAALAVALGLVFVTTAAAAPKPHVERARSGELEAVFSYTYDAAKTRFAHQHLTIRRGGVVRFAASLRRRPCDFCDLQPANYFSHTPSVSIRDLDGDGEPEVLLDLYWGGAHCCWFTKVFRYLPRAGIYRALTHTWGNVGYGLKDLDGDGLDELVTADDRFAYAFASFADSTFPVRILRYREGRLAFVTTAYPAEIGRDATAQWRLAMSKRRLDNQGILAAWTADECMLGHAAAAFSTLDHLRGTGLLHGEQAPAAYLKRLRRFLRRTGYL